MNINPELEFVEETLATCKFAQRLSSINTVDVMRNKEINIRALVKKLKAENVRLNEALEKAGKTVHQQWMPSRADRAHEMGQLRSAADTFLAPDDPQPNFRCTIRSGTRLYIWFVIAFAGSALASTSLGRGRGRKT